MATNTPFGQRLGLGLEGGAMRGIYTAGVLDVFLEAGIMPDVVVGVSAGALPVSYTHLTLPTIRLV